MTYLETGVYRLSTLSPVHIRAGEPKLYGQGFIRLNNTDDFLYVVDPLKLQSEIFVLGLDAVNTYTEVFSDLQPKMHIAQVLKRIGYDYRSNIEKISNGIVRLPSGNRFMRSGLEQHFIPGSSIKGAIKTAVLYDNVKTRIAEGSLDLDAFVEKQIKQYQRKHGERDKKKIPRTFRGRSPERCLSIGASEGAFAEPKATGGTPTDNSRTFSGRSRLKMR